MIVQMTVNMSGGRHDDRAWPPAWVDFEVPDWEGRDLVRSGIARFVRHSGTPSPPPVQEPSPAAVVSEPARTAHGPVSEDEPPQPPKAVDPKQVWADYAVSLGEDEEHVATLTKAQLMERYGSRA